MTTGENSGSGNLRLPSRRGTLAAEHAALAPRIVALRTLIDCEFSWDEARVALSDLRRTLLLHFALEEAGGYLAEVLSLAPEHAVTIARLEFDHQLMRSDLTRLLAEAVAEPAREDLRRSVHGFLTVLATHEHGENAIVQSVLMADLPGGE